MAAILSEKREEVERGREAAFLSPRPAAEGADEEGVPEGTDREPPVEVPATLALRDALRIATLANRDYEARTESLYLSALSLSGTRFLFGPQVSSAIAYLATDADGRRRVYSQTADLRASQVLPTGGTLSGSAVADAVEDREAGLTFDTGTTATVSLTQPLLRGAGYESSHEALTQAERDVVYDIREFSRFREQFLIDVTRRFYALVAQREVVRNTEERYKTVEFQARRTQALFEVGRQGKIEVLRAENDMLRVRNDLVDARDAYNLALDEFKVFLGLPTTVEFALAEDPPPFVKVDVSLRSAVESALRNRLDLANSSEQLEDADRALRIAGRNLLPDLDLVASHAVTSDRTGRVFDQSFGRRSSSVGVTLEIPLQRTLERNALRSAQIARDRARREHVEFRDRIVVEVRDTLRRLRQAAVTLEIQERIISVEEKRVEKARIDFEAGEIGNRDVLEAEQSLLAARNDRIRAMVDYEIARIELERVMGTIEVARDGTWRSLRAPAPGEGPEGPGESAE